MTLPSPEFPKHISNTQRQLWVACPQKWYWSYCIPGTKKAVRRGVDLVAGGALAKGLEATRKAFFDEGCPAYEAEEIGLSALAQEYGPDLWPTHLKSLRKTTGALMSYLGHWPLESDYLRPHGFGGTSGTGIEFKFAVPLPVLHPTNGEPLTYEGRIDLIATHQAYGDALWIEDDKLTTRLGSAWHAKWKLDAQPTSYIWAARQHGFSVAGAIIRGTSCLTKSYGHEEAVVQRSEFQITDWYEQLLRDALRMIETFQRANDQRRPDRALDASSCAAYGGCAFLTPCSTEDPTTWLEQVLNPPENEPVDDDPFSGF